MPLTLHSQSQVVVVDARPTDYGDLVALGEEQCWNVHFLTTGCAAIKFLRRAQANLWMINTWLPDLPGFELYDILREQFSCASVVLISDHPNPEHERLACQKGATLYLCKSGKRRFDCQPLAQLVAPRRSVNVPYLAGNSIDSCVGTVGGSVAD